MNITNESLIALLRQVESAVDESQDLTRVRPSGLSETAEFAFNSYHLGNSGWFVRLKVRNTRARGRGSRGFYDAHGDGDTPEQAVAAFMERLPFFVQATS